jgi:hypothetical protein
MQPLYIPGPQRFIFYYVLMTTVLSLCVILPINFQGTQYRNVTDFGHTTLSNLGG